MEFNPEGKFITWVNDGSTFAFLFFFFKVLKETLIRHGFTFESHTDTEVIPKLAKYVFDQAREGSFEFFHLLDGNYRIFWKNVLYL